MKIDKHIPPPVKHQTAKRKYPFREMEVGDSTFIAEQRLKGGAYASAMKHGRRYGKKFIGRTEGDGLRIWRVK